VSRDGGQPTGGTTSTAPPFASAPGSLRYFSVLFAPADRRPLLEALYAFESAVRDSLAVANHEAAHVRLQWWRGEVDRLMAGRPQHPAMSALLALRRCAGADVTLLHEVLAGADLDLAGFTYSSWQELEAYCFRAAGALQTLHAAGLAGERDLTASERTFARALGSAVRQTELLRDLAPDLARGRLYVPLAALEAAGIDPALVPAAGPAALQGVVHEWRARLNRRFAELPSMLAAPERRTQRPGLVLAALHQQLLARAAAAESPAGASADFGPWRRLWTAWRTAVRYA